LNAIINKPINSEIPKYWDGNATHRILKALTESI